jgi:membrane-associated HD superfamily phosphohydrolase
MNNILKSISFIFHPLLIPLLGVVFYFAKSPKYISLQIIQAKLISLFILTIVLPILLYFLLKTLGKAKSIYLETTKERIFPLIVNCIVVLLVLNRILTANQIIELYYFFVGILISTLACLFLVLMKIKASIHMTSIAGLFMFFIALSIHFSININGTLAIMFILTGAIATSRLHLKAHTAIELIIGFFIGFMPQLILLNYWL